MLVRENYPQGFPCWVELRTLDLHGARSFYGGLFGWEFDEHDLLFGEGYLVAKLRGHRVAGIAPTRGPADESAGWTSHFAVKDVVAAVGRVVREGGRAALAPHNIGSAGRAALVLDPEGNAFGLWEKVEAIGAELAREPGAFTWTRLTTADATAMKEFYCALFGFHTSELPLSPGNPSFAFAIDYDLVASLTPQEVVPELEPKWLPYFAVADISAATATVERLGGEAVIPHYQLQALGTFGAFRDPQGAVFMLWQPLTPEILTISRQPAMSQGVSSQPRSS